MTIIKTTIAIAFFSIILGIGFIYSGIYPIGADNRHNGLTFWILETLRVNSIERASKNIEVPDLSNPQLLLSGGADYNDMCSGCHLKPGVQESDISLGLYPAPPNLTLKNNSLEVSQLNTIAQQHFWVIKHGIMASGMAAFGPTHDDERIWAMVAFIQKLPDLNETQYQILTARK